MTDTLLDLSAAADALARRDEGLPLPGDTALIDAHERACRQRNEVLHAELDAIERAEWLATQCGVCDLGGFGPECDMHVIEHEVLMKRAVDR